MEKIDHRKMKYLNKSETLEALKVCITRSRNKFYFLDYFVEKLVMNERGMELKTFSSFLLLFFFFLSLLTSFKQAIIIRQLTLAS